ncbi:MAG: GNAT family N-acetyltransferase, partial [Clostridium sp.]|nr:GNAT family N-acetyltransferase [Clostridium sp.]
NPSYQDFHIGTELMTRLLDKYNDMLHIKIMPSDPAVIPFYERLGFKRYDNYTAMEIMRL